MISIFNNRYRLVDTLKESVSQPTNQMPVNLRAQQLEEISSAETSINESEQTSDSGLKLALSALAITTAGALFYPLLSLAALPGLGYLIWPTLKESYTAIVKERRIKVVVVNSIVVIGLLLTAQYFACALTVALLMLCRQLLVKVEDHSLKSTINLFGQRSRFAWLLSNDMEVEVPIERVQKGDVIVVHAGEMIPVDGTICRGVASIDQRALTGEAQPAEKEVGDSVLAATVILAGELHIQVEKAGTETTAAQITKTLNQTVDFKEQLHWRWMEWLDNTAWITLLSGALSLPLLGLPSAITVMYAVSFGYSMRILAPLALLSYLNLTSQQRILIKDGRSLELLKEVDTVVFDKTGTLTEEVPTLSTLYPLNGYSEVELLTHAAAAEYKQTHPIALAILAEAQQRNLTLPKIDDAHYQIGYGLAVQIGDNAVCVGSVRFMEMEQIAIPAQIEQIQAHCYSQGHSLICVAINGEMGGAIELTPTIRPEAKQIVDSLHERGMSLYIISGDHEKPTQKLATTLGIEHFFAETLPENKASLIRRLQAEGRTVCFVGDGINDSIALKTANLSISLSGATNIAIDAAQVVLMDGTLKQLDRLFDIASDFDKNMQTNFAMSLIPTVLSIGGVFLFNLSFVTSVFLYYSGLGLGLHNAMRPLLQSEAKKGLQPPLNRMDYGHSNGFSRGRDNRKQNRLANYCTTLFQSGLSRLKTHKQRGRLIDAIID